MEDVAQHMVCALIMMSRKAEELSAALEEKKSPTWEVLVDGPSPARKRGSPQHRHSHRMGDEGTRARSEDTRAYAES